MDLRCYDDLDELATETDDPREELAQDNYHVLITPRGGNPDDPEGGIGVHQLLSGRNDPRTPERIEGALLRDPRNGSVRVLITPIADEPEGYHVAIDIETNFGPLSMGLDVTSAGVERTS